MGLLSWIFFFDTNREFSIFKKAKNQKINYEVIKYGYSLIPSHLINLSNNLVSSTIISSTLGFNAYSVYQVAAGLRQKVADTIKFIHPLLYADLSIKSDKDIFERIKPYIKSLFALSTAFTILSILAGSFYIRMFFGQEYQLGILYYLLLSLAFPASIVTLIFTTAFEAKLKGKLLQRLSIQSDVVKTILTAIGSILAGPIGASVAFSVGGWAMYLLYSNAFTKKFLKTQLKK
jgi:O-antigen/teichoic acid export membrane protein